MTKKQSLGLGGAFFGLIVGYPLSYLFQPGALRAKMSLGDYIQHISDVFNSKDLAPTAIGVWIGSVVIFGFIGILASGMVRKNRDDEEAGK